MKHILDTPSAATLEDLKLLSEDLDLKIPPKVLDKKSINSHVEYSSIRRYHGKGMLGGKRSPQARLSIFALYRRNYQAI